MMKVKITYMDGKDLEVNIATKDSQKFFDAIGKHQFYFDDRKGRGFWTDVDKIRHMVVEELPARPEAANQEAEGSEGNQGDSPNGAAPGDRLCGSKEAMGEAEGELNEVADGDQEAQ